MNDLNNDINNGPFTQKLKQIFVKLIKNVLDIKNIVRMFELVLLLAFNLIYGRKPIFTW